MDAYLESLISLKRLPNARRPESQTNESLIEESLAKVQKYLATPVEEDVLVEDESKAHRQWLMRTWNEFFNARQMNPKIIWHGLCLGDPVAIAWSKAYLSDRVERSVRRVMVLGPEEYEEKRMLNSASTVLAAWRALIKEADLTILRDKRQEEPTSGDRWRLRFHSYNAKPPSSSISVFEISKWIWSDLAAEHGLSKEITFKKLEATAEDAIIILRTLWERAAELGIDMKMRIPHFQRKTLEYILVLLLVHQFRQNLTMAELYVVIYLNCDPNDTPHWCLHSIDDDGDEIIYEAFGSSGTSFRYNTCPVVMASSKSEKKQVKIGRIEADVWPEISDLFAGVPMSTQVGWNCQNWVMEAISSLKRKGFLEEEENGLTYIQGKYQKKKSTY